MSWLVIRVFERLFGHDERLRMSAAAVIYRNYAGIFR
jgi:hypothetical protein